MATSGSHTTGYRNFAKVSLFLIDICTELFRRVLRWHVPPQDFQSSISGRRQDLHLFSHQVPLLFPVSGRYRGSYEDFDITLLYTLLRNIANIPPHSKGWGNSPDSGDFSVSANIDRIREVRNDYFAHATCAATDDTVFNRIWTILKQAVIQIEHDELGGTYFRDEIEILEDKTLDPEMEKEYISMILKMNEQEKDTKQRISEVQDEMRQKGAETRRKIADMAENIRKDFIDPSHEKKTTMIKQTENMVNFQDTLLKDTFLETTAFKNVLSSVKKSGCVVITGLPGDGKTTLALKTIKCLMKEGKRAIQIFTHNDWDQFIQPGENLAIFIDDMFGEISVDKSALSQWSTRMHLIEALVSEHRKTANRLVVTVRTDIFKACELQLKSPGFFRQNEVNISDDKSRLSLNEAKLMLRKYLPKMSFHGNNKIYQAYLEQSSFGFPQCCRILKENASLQRCALEFFKDPTYFLNKEFLNRLKIKDISVAVFVYILMKGGRVDYEKFCDGSCDIDEKELAMKICETIQSIVEFQSSAQNLMNSFLLHRQDNVVSFSHCSIQASVFLCIGKIYPKKVIQHCDHTLLRYLTTKHCETSTLDSLEIHERLFPVVCKKLERLMKSKDKLCFDTIAKLSLWQNERFFKTFCRSHFSTAHAYDEEGKSIMEYFASSGNIAWIQFLIVKLNTSTVLHKSLNAACEANQFEVVDLLLKHKGAEPDITTFFCAVKAGSLEIFLKLSKRSNDVCKLGESNRWNLRNTVIQEACLWNHFHLIKPLIELHPCLISMHDSSDQSILHYLAFKGNIPLLVEVLENGPNPYHLSKYGHSILHIACIGGHVQMCKHLLEHYEHLVIIEDNNLISPIHFAACGGFVQLFDLLVSKRVNPFSVTSAGETVLHFSCLNGKEEMTRYIVHQYPQMLFMKTRNNFSALHFAACSGNLELFRFLVQKGLSIQDTSTDGETILHSSCLSGHLNITRYVIETFVLDMEGGSPVEKRFILQDSLLNVKDKEGNTPLHFAVYSGNEDLFRFLEQNGMQVDALTNKLRTILHYSCLKGHLDLSIFIAINYNHLKYFVDCFGKTALHYAVDSGNVKLFSFLIDKGLSVAEETRGGETVLYRCCRKRQLNMLKLALEKWNGLHVRCCGKTLLCGAVESGDLMIFKFLVGKGANASDININHDTALHVSCLYGHVDLTRYIIKEYRFFLERKSCGKTPLHVAAQSGNEKIFILLLQSGCDIMSKTDDGESVLHLSCLSRNQHLCEYIVNLNERLFYAQDKRGRSICHAAAFSGSISLFDMLFSNSLHLMNVTKLGETVLHFSCCKGDLEMTKYLIARNPCLLFVRDSHGKSVLHLAADSGNVPLFEYINCYSKYALLRETTNKGENVLHRSCAAGKVNLSAHIINMYGVHFLKSKDCYGRRPLCLASESHKFTLSNLFSDEMKAIYFLRDEDTFDVDLGDRNATSDINIQKYDMFSNLSETSSIEGYEKLLRRRSVSSFASTTFSEYSFFFQRSDED